MATQSRSIRRGLPRVEGGDPWPPAGEAPARIVTAEAARRRLFPARNRPPPRPPPRCPRAAAAQETAPGTTAVSAPVPAVNSGAAVPRQLRRGLPRVPGGEPWPPAGEAPASVAALSGAPAAGATPRAGAESRAGRRRRCSPQAVPAATPSAAAPATAPATPTTGTTPLRRGLPRVPGGEPWPPAGLAPAVAVAPAVAAAPAVAGRARTHAGPPPRLPACRRPLPRRSRLRRGATAPASAPAVPAAAPAAPPAAPAPAAPVRRR